MRVKKLYITDLSDPSVGLWPITWEVDVPLYIPDHKKMSKYDKEILKSFQEDMVNIYKDFCDGECFSQYDYEMFHIENKSLKD